MRKVVEDRQQIAEGIALISATLLPSRVACTLPCQIGRAPGGPRNA